MLCKKFLILFVVLIQIGSLITISIVTLRKTRAKFVGGIRTGGSNRFSDRLQLHSVRSLKKVCLGGNTMIVIPSNKMWDTGLWLEK